MKKEKEKEKEKDYIHTHTHTFVFYTCHYIKITNNKNPIVRAKICHLFADFI